MKTTIRLSDDLYFAAKDQARRDKTTLRALVEEGLRSVLRSRREGSPFRLADASVPGKGVEPGLQEGDWADVRARIYRGRGG